MGEALLSIAPGAALLVAGLVCALLRGRAVAPLGLVATLLEALRLSACAGLPFDPTGASREAFGCDGVALAGSAAILVVVGLVSIASARRHPAVESAAAPGLALGLAGVALAAAQANDLRTLALLLLVAGAIELVLTPGDEGLGRDPESGEPTAWPQGWRSAALAALASPCLIGLGAQGRMNSGGSTVLEWIGTPFAGDTPTTLLFLGLAIPVALPPTMGGTTFSLAAGPVRHDEGSYLHPGLLRGIVLIVALARGFSGTDALLTFGLVATVLAATLVVLGRRSCARRLGFAVHAASGLLLGVAAIASETAADALALGIVALGVSAAGAALALVHITNARGIDPGLAPDGLGRQYPTVFAFATISALGLAALPGTLAFDGRALGLGALSVDGAGAEALIFALALGPVAAFACIPFVTGLFFSPSRVGVDAPTPAGRATPGAPPALVLSMGLAAAASVALAAAPEALDPFLPFGSVPGDRFPTSVQQVQLLLGALLVALLFGRRLDSSTTRPDTPLSSSP